MWKMRTFPVKWFNYACALSLLSLGWALTSPKIPPPSIKDRPQSVVLNDIQNVYCLSDLHMDHVDNQKWLNENLPASNLTQNDLLIVAGDISHEFQQFEDTLRQLRKCCQVFFVPGNHEAWVGRQTNDTSLDKLDQVQDVCRRLDVHVDPLLLNGPQHPVWIVPVQSWYDGTLSFDEDLCRGFGGFPWADFVRCRWPADRFPPMGPPDARIPDGLVEFFHEHANAPILSHVLEEQALLSRPAALMTVSHFLPNPQCLPDWKDLQAEQFALDRWLDHGAGEMSAKFAKVAGSKLLDVQLRSITTAFGEHVHIFGHSHRPKDFTLDGVRYIHNPLGKPRERALHMVNPQVTFQPVWNHESGQIAGPTILRYWEQFGGGTEALKKRLEKVRGGRYHRSSRNSRKHNGSSQSTVY